MSYEEQYPVRYEVSVDELGEAQKIVIAGLIRQGEFTAREHFIQIFQEEIKSYLDGVDGEPNEDWVDGLSYAIQLVKEMKVITDA